MTFRLSKGIRNKCRSLTLAGISVTAMCVSGMSPGHAQEATAGADAAADTEDHATDVIVITAQRRLQTILDVPVSASVFNAEKIEAANFDDAKDYLLQTPNVSFQQGGRNGAREIVIAIRGISDLKGSEKVLTQSAFATYIDEFSAGTLASGQSNPDIYDVEAVEILRGPQGVFFGRNSEGGAINIRTRKPTEDFYGRVDFGVGRFNTYELSGVVNGKIAENLFARLTVHGETTDGPLDNKHEAGGESDADYVHVRGQLRWEPTERTTYDLQISHSIDNSGIQPKIGSCINQGAFGLPYNLSSPALLGGTPSNPGGIGCYDAKGEFKKWASTAPPPPQLGGLSPSAFRNNEDSVYQDTPDHTDNETTLVISKLSQELNDDIAFTAVAGYSESDQDQFLDLDRSGIKAINRYGAFHTKSHSLEGRLSSIGEDNNIDWLVGGIYYHEKFNAVNQILIEQVLGPWVPGDKANENRIKNTLEGWAAFANAEWHINDELSLIVGGRYSYDHGKNEWSDVYAACGRRPVGAPLDTSTAVNGNGPCLLTPDQQLLQDRNGLPQFQTSGGPRVTGGRYAQNAGSFAENGGHDFSPRVALNWKPNDNASVYGIVSKGYKPGGGQGNPDGGLGITSEFGKEELWNYEVGGNAYLFDGKLLLQGALFYMEWKDYQFLSRQTLCVLTSTGELVVVTPALDLSTCSRQLQVDGTQNLPKARSQGFELSSLAHITDSTTLSGSLGYLDAEYRKGVGLVGGVPTDLKGISIGSAPKYTASATIEQEFPLMGGDADVALTWSYRSGTSLSVVETATQTFPTKVDAISLFNLRFTQQWGNNRFAFNVDNLFDSEYFTATEGFSFVGPQLTYNPRTWSVKWTTEF